jgi:hypothetical protein
MVALCVSGRSGRYQRAELTFYGKRRPRSSIVPFHVPPPEEPSTMATAVQRPLKGSRISTFYPVKNLPALSTLDSAFQLQEFISLTIRLNIHDVQAIVSIPDSRSTAEGGSDDGSSALADEPDGDKDARNEFLVDEACWIYEQLRYAVFYALTNLSGLAVSSLDDLPRIFPIP